MIKGQFESETFFFLNISGTYNPVNIVCPGSSFAFPTPIRSTILCKRSKSPRSCCTLAAILDSDEAVLILNGSVGAFRNGVFASLVVSFQKHALSIDYWDCSTPCVFVATNPQNCKKTDRDDFRIYEGCRVMAKPGKSSKDGTTKTKSEVRKREDMMSGWKKNVL